MILRGDVSCSFTAVAEETKTISNHFSNVFLNVVSCTEQHDEYICLVPIISPIPQFSFHAGCPDGQDIVNCLVNPCEVTSCPGFPTATCEADFCGGCNARFFLRGREVTNKCGK